jgi:hypothetical protein
MDHPFFNVTNSSGEFMIKDIPVGKYTIEAWHEIFGTQTAEIEIAETTTQTLKLNFDFKEKGK